jgi:hypothetical protein
MTLSRADNAEQLGKIPDRIEGVQQFRRGDGGAQPGYGQGSRSLKRTFCQTFYPIWSGPLVRPGNRLADFSARLADFEAAIGSGAVCSGSATRVGVRLD